MYQTIQKVEAKYKKKQVVDVRSGDTVRVHQKIREGNKERIQVFEGFVIRTDRKKSLTSRITVRRISSGVGVEKSFLLHSPLIVKVEVVKRAKVRRKNLSYMRLRSGKSARLAGVAFDKEAVNTLEDIMDKEVGEAEKKTTTDVTKKEKAEVEEEKVDDKADKETEVVEKDDDKSESEAEKSADKDAKTEEKKAHQEEDKQLSKKEKAEAFRKSQEDKKKK